MSCACRDRGPQIRTARLLLRRWRSEDLPPFADMNADPAVMEHFPSTLSAAESDALAERIETCFEKRAYGLFAIEVPGVAPFIGFTGLSPVELDVPFAPVVEVGWRLAQPFWGHGFATEAARAAISYGFERVDLQELVSFTTVGNVRSRRVMERLGMRRNPDEDFEHPKLPAGNPLRPHVLYRLRRRAP